MTTLFIIGIIIFGLITAGSLVIFSMSVPTKDTQGIIGGVACLLLFGFALVISIVGYLLC